MCVTILTKFGAFYCLPIFPAVQYITLAEFVGQALLSIYLARQVATVAGGKTAACRGGGHESSIVAQEL